MADEDLPKCPRCGKTIFTSIGIPGQKMQPICLPCTTAVLKASVKKKRRG